MFSTSDLVSLLERSGVSLSLHGSGILKVSSRAEIPSSLSFIIQGRKREILEVLSRRDEITFLQGVSSRKTLEKIEVDRTDKINPKELQGRKLRPTVSPVALAWLLAHRLELKAAGWTGRELYQRNKSKSIMWLKIWNRPGLEAKLTGSGIVEFWFSKNGKLVRQTARPMNVKK